ncbi:uncharacterized protein LY79DRAFT_676758 [Colletotrichum navitas]|uniref:Uncharacterized protein n=1 Tax=Colletotrichum navitas TaxID=681940 RepID=A0AAD8VAT6_9PEZI|nr:uncharacterized protein LY79DRAFT_676758 [Colletotrichum navitas]KAK1600767.1 hypothetical protein LY79DRAFT_676758 [Colletotrichum navitas]
MPGPSHRIPRRCAFAGVQTHLGCFVIVCSVLDASSDTSITVPLAGNPVGCSSSATLRNSRHVASRAGSAEPLVPGQVVWRCRVPDN